MLTNEGLGLLSMLWGSSGVHRSSSGRTRYLLQSVGPIPSDRRCHPFPSGWPILQHCQSVRKTWPNSEDWFVYFNLATLWRLVVMVRFSRRQSTCTANDQILRQERPKCKCGLADLESRLGHVDERTAARSIGDIWLQQLRANSGRAYDESDLDSLVPHWHK